MITDEWLKQRINETEQLIEIGNSNIYAVHSLTVRLLVFKEVLSEHIGVAYDMKREHTISMIGIERYNELQLMKDRGDL